jgi:hypothetical protein
MILFISGMLTMLAIIVASVLWMLKPVKPSGEGER